MADRRGTDRTQLMRSDNSDSVRIAEQSMSICWRVVREKVLVEVIGMYRVYMRTPILQYVRELFLLSNAGSLFRVPDSYF